MTQQKQNAGDGATAIQAGGSVTIFNGLSPDQMSEIMVSMAKQMATFQAQAEETAKQRFEEFREKVLTEFTRAQGGNPAAFQDPDFQYLLNEAQNSYARSGDQNIGDTLVQIISERSNKSARDRLTLSLNAAVRTAPLLTHEDFSVLSVSFAITRMRGHPVNLAQLNAYAEQYIFPMLDDLREESSSYEYLAAQGCVAINPLGATNPAHVFLEIYPGLFSKGFMPDELANRFPKGVKTRLIPNIHDPAKQQFGVSDEDTLEMALAQQGAEKETIEAEKAFFKENKMSEDQVKAALERLNPKFSSLERIYSKSPIRSLQLTTLGVTLAHANLKRISPAGLADLSIWIQ